MDTVSPTTFDTTSKASTLRANNHVVPNTSSPLPVPAWQVDQPDFDENQVNEDMRAHLLTDHRKKKEQGKARDLLRWG
jgi:hypothetical protein